MFMHWISRNNGRAQRGLSLLVLAVSIIATSAACGSDDSSTPETQSASSALVESKDLKEQVLPKPQASNPGQAQAGFMDKLDITDTSARATSLALNANIEFLADGSLELSSIPSFGIDGIAKPKATPYTLRSPLFGREGNVRDLKAPEAKFDPASVRYNYADAQFTAIYERRPQGIKQSFEVRESPEGKGLLILKYNAPEGFRHSLDPSTNTIQINEDGKTRFQLRDLVVFDAESRRLPAQFFVEEDHFGYAIDDSNAVYPLNVDPLLYNPATVYDGENTNAEFGYIVSSAGDLNSDGYDDIVIGEPQFANGETREGRVVVFLGSAAGLLSTASVAIESDLINGEMGTAIEPLGDINGDGFEDLAVSVPFANSVAGTVLVFAGQSAATPTDPAISPTFIMSIDGNPNDQFGASLASGDINCDGRIDLVVGAPGKNALKGSVAAFYGNGSDFSNAADWQIDSPDSQSYFGNAVAIGNLDGDANGCDDIAVSAPYWNRINALATGRVKVYLGQNSGPSMSEDWKYEGTQASSYHGISLAIDDFNGDGIDDLVFGANLFDSPTQNDVGRVYVFYGSSSTFPDTNAIINGFSANEQFGFSVGSAGDFNADGYADLLVGAFKHSGSLIEQGAAYLFPGTSTGLSQTPSWTAKGAQAGDGFGRNVHGAGDVNGDGYSDFIIGAYRADIDDGSGGTLLNAGQVFVYHGGPTCFADGKFYQDGDINPANSCQVCDAASGSIDGWMNVDDALAQSCDDGNLCTENDVCVAGACVGTVKDCALDPSQACTIGICDPSDGVCKTEGLPTTSQCEPAACVSETEAVAAGFCDGDANNDGSGVCLVPTTVDCAPFKCNAGACRTSCNRDSQCATGAWCDRNTDECSTANRAPTAHAGADQIATMGSTVTLDGTASSDPDGDALTYAWTQTSGEPVTFVDATSSTPEFDVPSSANDQDVLEFQLVVNDGTVDSAPSDTSVLITARPNTKPSAVITGPTTAEAGEMITLSAADSSDPEGDSLIYTWSLVSGEPAPNLGDASAEEYEVTFPTDVTTPTTYTFLLVVNDGRVNSNPATHNVRVTPAEVSEDVGPETDAGPDAGPDAESDAGVDAGDDAGDDAGNVNELGGDLAGSGCSCSSGADGQPLTPGMLFGAMALGGLALARRRRWMN